MTRPVLTADAWRENNWWVIDVHGVGVTQTDRQSSATDAARDLVRQMQHREADVHVTFR